MKSNTSAAPSIYVGIVFGNPKIECARFGICEINMIHESNHRCKGVQKAKGEIRPATLYRVLRLLVDSQILMEHHFGGKTLFERIDCKHHDHIICEKCEKITEFHSYEIEKIQENIMKEKGFILTSHKHELYGLCKKCQ